MSVFFFTSNFGQIPTGQAFCFSRALCYGLPLPILFAPPHKKPSFVPVMRSSRRAILKTYAKPKICFLRLLVAQNSPHSLRKTNFRFGNVSAVAFAPFFLRRPAEKKHKRAEYFFQFFSFVMLFAGSPLLPCKKSRQSKKIKKSKAPARLFFFVMLFALAPLRPSKKTRQK